MKAIPDETAAVDSPSGRGEAIVTIVDKSEAKIREKRMVGERSYSLVSHGYSGNLRVSFPPQSMSFKYLLPAKLLGEPSRVKDAQSGSLNKRFQNNLNVDQSESANSLHGC